MGGVSPVAQTQRGGVLLLALLTLLPAAPAFAQSRVEHRIRWGAVPGAIGYQVQVRGPTGRVVVDLRTQNTTVEFTVEEGAHYVRLGAINKFGEPGSWSAWAPLSTGRAVEDPRAVAERKRAEERKREAEERKQVASKRSVAAKKEAEAKREQTVQAIREEIRQRVEEATGEFTLSSDAVIRGTIVESREDTVLIRTDAGLMEVRRNDIVEARVRKDGAEKVVPASELRGIREHRPEKPQPRLTSGSVPKGRLELKGETVVVETRVGRIPLRPEDLEHGPKAPAPPPGPELKEGEFGVVRLKGGGEIVGRIILRTEYVLVVNAGHGQIELSLEQVAYTRPSPPPEGSIITRARRWLGI